MKVIPDDGTARQCYRLMTGCIVPRPIAWVTSRSGGGSVNAAPFSYFNAVQGYPPMLVFSPGYRRAGVPKDTLVNVGETGEFVVHIVNGELAEAMNMTAAQYPADQSELDIVDLETVPGDRVAVPRIAAAPAAFECEVHEMVPLGEDGNTAVFGRVLAIHVDGGVVDDDGRVRFGQLDAVGRLAGPAYSYTRDFFAMIRPQWERYRRDPEGETRRAQKRPYPDLG